MDNNEENQNPTTQPVEVSSSYKPEAYPEQPSPPVATVPLPSDQLAQPPVKSTPIWPYYLLVLGILQAIGVALIIILVIVAMVVPGIGLAIGLLLPITIVPVLGLITLINLVALPIYMGKYKPRGKVLVFSILSLIVSIGIALYAVYIFAVLPAQYNDTLAEQGDYDYDYGYSQSLIDNADPEITKEEAIDLLETCQLMGFYYTNQTNKENGGWGELSTTGVVLTKVDGKPYRISIADRLIPELVPIAREAQKTCDGPQFWHDGHYEQKQDDGTWQ